MKVALIGNGLYCKVGTRTARATDRGMFFPALVDTKPAGAAVLNIREVSQLTNLSIETLKHLNLTGSGPAFTEERGCVRYTVEAVAAWQVQRSLDHQRLMDSFGGGYAR